MRFTPFDRATWRAHLRAWCEQWLDAPPRRTLFEAGWQSAVVGIELRNGERVVVKVRRSAPRLHGCFAVQQAVWRDGFPCPEPLVAPAALGHLVASAERYVDGGDIATVPDAGPFAALLARLLHTTPPVVEAPDLDPPPDWARWDHSEARQWPAPRHDEVDLNAHRDPPEFAAVVTRVRARLAAQRGPNVVGHADFESQNVRWRGGAPHVVHDWDSLCIRAEAAFVGMAAAVFPADERGAWSASLAQTEAFLDAYARARTPDHDRAWSAEDDQVAWAAGMWTLCYNAKAALMRGRDDLGLRRFVEESPERLRRAGA